MIFIKIHEDDKALISTTDIPNDGRAEDVTDDVKEVLDLPVAVNRFLKKKLRCDDMLRNFPDVRVLPDEGQGNP